MDPAMKKNSSSKSGSDNPSPVLLRRRLSAPETVMRKYKLAKARSQDSDTDPSSDSKFGELSYDSHSGSEMNLQKKRDAAVMMRKSTLLRKLMNNPKAFGSSSFQEWQHYCGKLSTPSLNSLQGSPEHMSKSYSRRSLIGYEYKTSPKHTLGSKKVSPVHQLYETHKKSPVHLTSMSPKRRLENHGISYQLHSTKPKGSHTLSSLRSSVNDLSKSTIGHSDSAYSNDRSNISLSSASTCSSNNTHLTTQESICYKNIPLENNPENMDQRNVDENRNFSVNTNVNYVTQETSTQTTSTTNLNVISNVKLSQKTLDLIVNEVMKDVQKGCTNGNDIQDKTAGSIHVRKISGSNEKSNGTIERPNETKYLTDARLQAQGHNSSRVSVISSKSSIGERLDNIDDHSDVASIADSLEDTSSSRLSLKKYDDKPVRGDLPPIPIRGRKKLFSAKPPDAFFVPMKTEAENVKSVSDYLPEKLKEKILRRQKNRQDKVDQYKSSLDFWNSKETTNESSKSRHIKNKARFRKPLLPSIESIRKSQKEAKTENREEKNNPKKAKRKSRENPPHTSRKSKSTGNHHNERHFHLYTSENDYFYEGEPKRIYHKAEFRNSNRRIEILEIMECVDLGAKLSKITTKTKSKIPLLKSPKLTKTTSNPVLVKKATYLDFSELFKADPKLDQLISDILIQSLNNNREEPEDTKTSNLKTENKEFKHHEDFTVIPEESTQQSSNNNNEHLVSYVKRTIESGIQVSEDDLNKSNSETNQVPEAKPVISDSTHKEEPSTKDSKNTQTFSHDWERTYSPQKKEEPSFVDQAPNEGRRPVTPKVEMKDRKLGGTEEFNFSSEEWRRCRTMQEEYEFESSSNDRNDFYKKIILPPPLPKRYGQSSRRPRYRDMSNGNPTPGEWSIILSGTNNAAVASDLEMKIRFPSSRRTNCFPFNTTGEQRESSGNTGVLNDGTRFPHKNFNNFDNGNRLYNENNDRFRKLPGINNLRVPENQRVSDPVAAFKAMEITDIRPRQTKTSLRRYNMTRPKLHPLFETNVDNPNIESQYTGMLNRVPGLLSINGYSVSPDNKYIVPGMSRRNIHRHDCTSNEI